MPISALVVTIALFLVTASVNLQVPLYETYARAAGLGHGQTSIVFAAYIIGLLPVLIFLGGISDYLGRKLVCTLGLISAMVATGCVIVIPNIYALFIARLLQGVGVGLSIGTGTAYLTETLADKGKVNRSAYYAGIATSLGFGSGPLLTSVSLWYENSLAPVSYWVILILTLICIVWIQQLPNNQIKSTHHQLVRLPYFPHGTVKFGLAIAVAWSVTGLLIAIVSTQLARQHLTNWIGLAVFLAVGTGALFQPFANHLKPKRCVRIGTVLTTIGYVFLVLGVWLDIIGLVLIGCVATAAASFGFTYLGGLTAVSKVASQDHAISVAGYFIFVYLGFALPSVLVGFLADIVGVINALVVFGIVITFANTLLNLRFKLSY